MSVARRLGEMKRGDKGTITRVLESSPGEDGTSMTRRLLEMGFVEGSTVEVIHEAPFGADPVAVRVRGALIALRRGEANLIEVSR